MGPYVDALVVDGEEASENEFRGGVIDTIAMGDVLIVLHILWRSVVIAYEFFLMQLAGRCCRML